MRLRSFAIAVSAVLGMMMIAVPVAAARFRYVDATRIVSDQQLVIALETFRPSDLTGPPSRVELADLDPDQLVRSEPSRCSPLTFLAADRVLSAGSSTGVNGKPRQPVRTLTVRFANANDAIATLATKRAALRRCHTVRLTFPPFTQPGQDFAVSSIAGPAWPRDRLRYSLVGDKRYDFYVRRFGNTLTWTYGDPDFAAAARQVVDELVDRLRELCAR